jgi:hypothetical protein
VLAGDVVPHALVEDDISFSAHDPECFDGLISIWSEWPENILVQTSPRKASK